MGFHSTSGAHARARSSVAGLAAGSLLVALAALGAISTGCARDSASSTTIVTSGRPPTGPTTVDDAALRLADEICKRKSSCAAAGPGGSSWRWNASAACVDRERPRVRAMLSSWNCAPVAAEARLESCLPAMKTATCEPLLADDERLPLCPANDACGRGALPGAL